MMNKRCFKCNKIKDINSFYKHKNMADGHLNKCKECTKKDIKRRYLDPESKQKIVAYEKKRFQDPKRKLKLHFYVLKMREKSPGKYRARTKLNNALRDGRIIKKPCAICGDVNSEAHHKDYRKYLDVIWLCRKHHLLEENKQAYL